MKRYMYMLFFALLPLAGCIEETELLRENGKNALEDGYLTVRFGHKSFERITVTTRSTVPVAAEDAIVNLYAIMFNSQGKRVYGRYFNLENRKMTMAELDASDCWYVNNEDSSKGGLTDGTVRMKAPVDIENGRLYLFANIDPVILNLSVEKLNLIKTETELQKMSLKFNQESTSRTGNLLMIGSADITIGADNSVSYTPDVYYKPDDLGEGEYNKISLERIDSKIEVNVAIVPGATTLKEDGNVQEIESFNPISWRVVNLPKDTWFLARAAIPADAPEVVLNATKEGGYFDSSVHLFETKTLQAPGMPGYMSAEQTDTKSSRTVNGFSFYMLETYHDESAHKEVSGYHQREKRLKNSEGEYIVGDDGNIWEYAPKDATYLVIDGEVQMKVNPKASADGRPQTLNALVTYYVHLGNFGKSTGNAPGSEADYNNYDIVCNTHYTYNINIKGVHSIEVEVVRDNSGEGWSEANETQSGATGEVFIAQEEIYTFDAHCGQRVFHFRFDAILKSLGIKVNNGIIEDYDGVMEEIADELTWYVSSPFGREGTPDIVNGNVEVPNGLDYKWVHFLVNDDLDSDGVYDDNNQWWPGKDYKGKVITGDIPDNPTAKGKTLMDVSQLCNYLRDQIGRKALGRDSDFDVNGEIVVTAFVDEYFYDVDPISGEYREGIWHEFVNKPMRMMHILCSADVSRDGESSATGSVVTIRQRSIQTIYNVDAADEGWGCETVDEIKCGDDEHRRSVGFYDNNSYTRTNGAVYERNNSKYNGLFNTVRLWKLDEGVNRKWSDYLDYNVGNNHAIRQDGFGYDVVTNFMKTGQEKLVYSCLMRNRDEDADGVIELDEVKWYLASTEQLITLFVGDLGLAGDARLYNLDNPEKGDYMSHVVSSTAYNEGVWPEIVWSEEGCSIGQYNEWNVTLENTSVRCVRNFGKRYDPLTDEDYPGPPIMVQSDGQGNYRFNMRELNDASKRIKVVTELVPMDETSEMSRVYDGFETGPLGNEGRALSYSTWKDDGDSQTNHFYEGSAMSYLTYIKDFLIQGRSYCPEGYRMPNIREAAVMHNYIKDGASGEWWGERDYAVCTYYSFGHPLVGGNGIESGNTHVENQATWRYSNSSMTLQGDRNRYVRCIRDIEPKDYVWAE